MKNKKTTIILSILLTLFLFLMLRNEHFALDSYVFSNDLLGVANSSLISGNIFMYIFIKICLMFSLSADVIKFVSLIMSLIIMFISSLVVNKMLSKYIFKDFWLGILSTGFVYSIFIFELFLFPESTCVMELGILFSILAVMFINKYFDNKKIYNLFISILFIIGCVLSNVYALAYFGIFSILFSILDNLEKKEFIRRNIYIVSIFIISTIIKFIMNVFLCKLDLSGYNFISSISQIIKQTYHFIIESSCVFPKYLFLLITILLFVICSFELVKSEKKSIIIKNIYLIIMVIILSVFNQLFVPYNDIWVVARNSFSIGLLPILMLTIYFSIDNVYDKYKIISIIIILLSLVIQLIGWYQIFVDHYYTNVSDRVDVGEILNNIKKYEMDNDIEINKISFAYDKNTKYNYDEVEVSTHDINIRAFTKKWAVENIINYYSDKKYEFIESNDEFNEYCSNNDWDQIRLQMFKYEDDTLYMCVY